MESNENGSDKYSRFQAAFDRGRQGEVDSFDIWLKDQGYRPDKISREAISDHFRNYPDLVPNHQDALEKLAEYIGFAITREEVHHIVIIGPTGIGKTQLLHSVLYYASDIDTDIETRLFDAHNFGDKVDDKFEIENRIDEIKHLDQSVLAIDDCHRDKRIDYSLKEFQNTMNIGIIISAWTPEGYSFNREKVDDSAPPSTELHLGPLSKPDTFTAIDSIFDIITKGAPEIDIEAKKQIHHLSHAVPSIVVILVVHSLHEAFVNNLEPGSLTSIEKAGARLHLDDAMNRIYELSHQKMEILRWILLSLNPRGRSPGDLVDKLDRDKSTISYHLRTLGDQGFVTSQSEGRRTFYQVPDHLTSLVQLRFEQDQEFHAEL